MMMELCAIFINDEWMDVYIDYQTCCFIGIISVSRTTATSLLNTSCYIPYYSFVVESDRLGCRFPSFSAFTVFLTFH